MEVPAGITPTAAGSLVGTPLAHLLVYLADNAVSGSVVFQIWADGRKIFDSGRMTGRDGAKSVNVDVSDVNELKLVVTNAGDGKSYDHADWADAKLIEA